MDCSKINELIKSSKNILLISHVNPDGDTLGSMCGLYTAIEDNFKKKCDMMSIAKIPTVYDFLPGIDKVKSIEEFDKSREYDMVITLDVASIDRICDAKVLFDKAKHTINFDHHKTNSNYAQINIVNPETSSTGELLFNCLKNTGWQISLNTAINFYTAILTDTGSFRFDNTKPETLHSAAELVSLGVSPPDIYRKVYESDTKTIAMFQAHCVSRAKFDDDDKIAYIVVYRKDMEKFGAEDDAFEGLTEKLRAIVTTRIAFVVKEMKSGGSKISMRSKFADAAQICGAFGGGGHKFAAGCLIKSPPQKALEMVLKEVRKHKL